MLAEPGVMTCWRRSLAASMDAIFCFDLGVMLCWGCPGEGVNGVPNPFGVCCPGLVITESGMREVAGEVLGWLHDPASPLLLPTCLCSSCMSH